MTRHSNRAIRLKGLRELAAECGESADDAMRAVGLSPDLLRHPEDRMPYDQLCALFEHCARAWRMPDFGLRISTYQDIDTLGPVALVTRMARDLRSAMNAIVENIVILSSSTVATVRETGDVAVLSVDAQPAPAGNRQYVLLLLAIARTVLEQAGNAPVELIEVTCSHKDWGVRQAARDHFGCPVRFDAEHNALFFDRAALDRPIERSDHAYHALIQRYLAIGRAEAEGRARDQVSTEIARQMEFGTCTLESVALRLKLEPRSLQRRLQREGVAFRDLVDQWRRARALSLVAHTRLPLSEVSMAMGYTDQSIFSRAFQRWYGATPLAYRHREAGSG